MNRLVLLKLPYSLDCCYCDIIVLNPRPMMKRDRCVVMPQDHTEHRSREKKHNKIAGQHLKNVILAVK